MQGYLDFIKKYPDATLDDYLEYLQQKSLKEFLKKNPQASAKDIKAFKELLKKYPGATDEDFKAY